MPKLFLGKSLILSQIPAFSFFFISEEICFSFLVIVSPLLLIDVFACCNFFFFFFSDAGDSLNDCHIMFITEIYKIEEHGSSADAPAGSESPLKSKIFNIYIFFYSYLSTKCLIRSL